MPSDIKPSIYEYERRDTKRFKKDTNLRDAIILIVLISILATFVHFVVTPMFETPKAEAQEVTTGKDCSSSRKDYHDKVCAEIAFQGFCKLAIANKIAIGEAPDQELLAMCNK